MEQDREEGSEGEGVRGRRDRWGRRREMGDYKWKGGRGGRDIRKAGGIEGRIRE